jgi:hypothetical protein
MNTRRVDYDQLSANFDRRYLPGEISTSCWALLNPVRKVNAQRIKAQGQATRCMKNTFGEGGLRGW